MLSRFFVLIGIFQPPAGKDQHSQNRQQKISREPGDGFDEHQVFQLSAADVRSVGGKLQTQVRQQQRVEHSDQAVSQIK